MKLAKPVANDRGAVLCGTGTALTEEVLARLGAIGIKCITVEGSPIDTGKPEKGIGERREELHARFKNIEGDPIMRKIKEIFLRRLKEAENGE